jgi:DNA-3-methyladenine glycosylase I
MEPQAKPKKPKSYCEYVNTLPADNVHRIYHDTQYGFPIESDNELFGRLILEINQAGLSWTTILNKQENFRLAYSNYEIKKIANYNQKDIDRLLANPSIIRNKLKINAAIYNAQKIVDLKSEFGSFKAWLNHHHPLPKEDWVRLFKKTFKFTGGEITNEFLMSSGYLKGAHIPSCLIFKEIEKLK